MTTPNPTTLSRRAEVQCAVVAGAVPAFGQAPDVDARLLAIDATLTSMDRTLNALVGDVHDAWWDEHGPVRDRHLDELTSIPARTPAGAAAKLRWLADELGPPCPGDRSADMLQGLLADLQAMGGPCNA